MKQLDWFLSVRENNKTRLFDILAVYILAINWHFTRNVGQNITELIPDWCDENLDVVLHAVARNVDTNTEKEKSFCHCLWEKQ